jgi:hypothetical protein
MDHHKFWLTELKNYARSYTWANNQEPPVMTAIGNIFCNIGFEQKYPLAFVITQPRAGSDHVPLILNFGIEEARKFVLFRFEKLWHGRDESSIVSLLCFSIWLLISSVGRCL